MERGGGERITESAWGVNIAARTGQKLENPGVQGRIDRFGKTISAGEEVTKQVMLCGTTLEKEGLREFSGVLRRGATAREGFGELSWSTKGEMGDGLKRRVDSWWLPSRDANW